MGSINLGSNGTITNLAVGGLPDGTVDADSLASNSVANVKVADDAIGIAELSATGTASSSTYLRGDNSWATVSSIGGATGVDFNDGVKARFGTDNDFELYHSGSDTTFNRPVSGAINFYFEDNDATTNHPIRIGKTQGASTNERHQMVSFGLPGVNRGIIQCGSSNTEAPNLVASSDYRIKENFRPYTGGWDAIKAIPVQLYDEKSPSYWTQGADKKDMKGWKAHEVQAVIPEAVTGTKDEVVTQAMIDAGNQYQQSELGHIIPQQLGTAAMIPTVIAALQQAMTKIETLETKVAALEAG